MVQEDSGDGVRRPDGELTDPGVLKRLVTELALMSLLETEKVAGHRAYVASIRKARFFSQVGSKGRVKGLVGVQFTGPVFLLFKVLDRDVGGGLLLAELHRRQDAADGIVTGLGLLGEILRVAGFVEGDRGVVRKNVNGVGVGIVMISTEDSPRDGGEEGGRNSRKDPEVPFDPLVLDEALEFTDRRPLVQPDLDVLERFRMSGKEFLEGLFRFGRNGMAINLRIQEDQFLRKAEQIAQGIEQPDRVPALDLL